ncbi:MAG TPA: MbcA/ParS/Xre antitoxin family protein [Gammaproteobacteria bacterium]|nr:MbcA/ParS/Xre antitoxin family protein [Gammaproteobacteria bacterium]
MPIAARTTKSIRTASSWSPTLPAFDASIAGRSIVDGLEYLKKQLGWSGTKIAHILHLPANTVNTWLKNHIVPINKSILQPDIQVIIHLLAIHRSLEAMFENPLHQQAWLSTFHPELNGIPEEIMGESIDGLILIRQYLDYVRGRGA